MLALLRGTVVSVGLETAVIETGGVGFAVMATPATLGTLRPGSPAEVATHLVVREDSLTLYAFTAARERDTFVTLQSVSGVGPKLALAMLAVLDADTIAQAVQTSDYATLERVPGVGRKSAQRLVLELSGKLATETVPVPATPASEQAVAALVNLGWADKVARAAVAAVGGDEVGAILRAALRHLGGNRG